MKLIIALAAAALLTAPSYAAACRDAKGKFIKCQQPTVLGQKGKCRDAKGHFAKCGSPGAKPA